LLDSSVVERPFAKKILFAKLVGIIELINTFVAFSSFSSFVDILTASRTPWYVKYKSSSVCKQCFAQIKCDATIKNTSAKIFRESSGVSKSTRKTYYICRQYNKFWKKNINSVGNYQKMVLKFSSNTLWCLYSDFWYVPYHRLLTCSGLLYKIWLPRWFFQTTSFISF